MIIINYPMQLPSHANNTRAMSYLRKSFEIIKINTGLHNLLLN